MENVLCHPDPRAVIAQLDRANQTLFRVAAPLDAPVEPGHDSEMI